MSLFKSKSCVTLWGYLYIFLISPKFSLLKTFFMQHYSDSKLCKVIERLFRCTSISSCDDWDWLTHWHTEWILTFPQISLIVSRLTLNGVTTLIWLIRLIGLISWNRLNRLNRLDRLNRRNRLKTELTAIYNPDMYISELIWSTGYYP